MKSNRARVFIGGACSVVLVVLVACWFFWFSSNKREDTSAFLSTQAESEHPQASEEKAEVEAPLVTFTAGSTVVTVRITEDTAVTRDFLAHLPMTLTFDNFNQSEEIAYPDTTLDTSDNKGMAPQAGDLFVYVPWGDIGFFYKVESPSFTKDLAKIGTTDDIDGILALEGQIVTIEKAD